MAWLLESYSYCTIQWPWCEHHRAVDTLQLVARTGSKQLCMDESCAVKKVLCPKLLYFVWISIKSLSAAQSLVHNSLGIINSIQHIGSSRREYKPSLSKGIIDYIKYYNNSRQTESGHDKCLESSHMYRHGGGKVTRQHSTCHGKKEEETSKNLDELFLLLL